MLEELYNKIKSKELSVTRDFSVAYSDIWKYRYALGSMLRHLKSIILDGTISQGNLSGPRFENCQKKK
jgi:hypothetical protein